MTTLVTGATGFVGFAVVRQLLARGEPVRVTVRQGSDTRHLQGLGLELVEADTRDPASVRAALKGCRRLFHVAAHFAHWSRDPALFYRVNVDGTRCLLEAALAEGLERVVYTSTANCFGAHGAGVLSTEASPFNEEGTGDHYAISKHRAEQVVLELCGRGLPAVIVNPTLVLGAGDRKPTPSGKLIVDLVKGDLPAYIDGATNLVDVEDVARGHLLAAERGRVGERYILGNVNLTVGELFALVGRVAGVKPPRFKVPYGVALALGYALDGWARLSGTPPVFTLSQVRIGAMGEHFSNEKAKRELGLAFTPLEETVERAVAWFRENGHLPPR